MRVNRITAAAVTVSLAGSLAIGAAGAASSAPAQHSPGDRKADRADRHDAQSARVARQADALRGGLRPLNQLTRVVAAVTQLKEGRLSPAQAARYRGEMNKALQPLMPPQAASGQEPRAERRARDMTARAAADLRSRTEALLSAAVKGTPQQRTAAANRALTGGSNLMAAMLYGGRLPAADLKGLPRMQPAGGVKQPAKPDPSEDQDTLQQRPPAEHKPAKPQPHKPAKPQHKPPAGQQGPVPQDQEHKPSQPGKPAKPPAGQQGQGEEQGQHKPSAAKQPKKPQKPRKEQGPGEQGQDAPGHASPEQAPQGSSAQGERPVTAEAGR
ncbi:hypothetical protein FM076_23900 [Streptomyces albus subsp. chlorinus]|uniref:hypothetical protein n=1 Tax=Streptomyces albus TaxID=1888 RepID=UPI00156E0804|nr:hypothetical protein [Streptomyces albus]NSC24025.1 hypothetical protein [Streptomyces albus subsp. chlorinus]